MSTQGDQHNIMSITHYMVGSGDDTFIVVVIPGAEKLLAARKNGHPNFDKILDLVLSGEGDRETFERLFDVGTAVAEKFERLSDRVQVGHGRVLFDGEQVDSSVTRHIVRYLDEDRDFTHLVRFMENVAANPNEHSREQLYDWLRDRDFTITPEGMLVGYKGVESDGQGGFRSISGGKEPVYVDGVAHQGQIPNPVGATVNMSRSLVQHDPSVGCHIGLHVGTWDYASNFARGAVLEVHVNPRDVVSVPTDCAAQKVRTCQYKVVGVTEVPYSTAGLDVDPTDEDSVPSEDEGLKEGDRVVDNDGDEGTVREDDYGSLYVEYDDGAYGTVHIDPDDSFFTKIEPEPEPEADDDDWDFGV